jgi:WD40 repeat protein
MLRSFRLHQARSLALTLALTSPALLLRAADSPAPLSAPAGIPIAEIKRTKPVDFATEIIPLFQKSCLACHNATDAKGDIVLETPALILKGGESGPGVVPGKPAESILLKVSAHLDKPFMPPKNNKADAKALTSEELGLLSLWIAQGATGAVSVLPPVRWQNLPESLNPILASAISSDGQYAAAARGNQIDIYEVPTLQYAGSLIDPALGAADRDLIESLAFSPDGQTIAAGSYRNVKLWKLDASVATLSTTNVFTNSPVTLTNYAFNAAVSNALAPFFKPGALAAISTESKRIAIADENVVRLFNVDDGKTIAELKGDRRALDAAMRQQRALDFAKSETAFRKGNVATAEKNQKTEAEALKKVTEAKAAADKTLADKNEASKKANEAKAAAQKVLSDTTAAIAQANENKNLSQKLIETAEAAAKGATASAAEAAQIFTRAQGNRDAAYADIINLGAVAKADAAKTAEAHAAIDRALVIKLSFEHAQSAKAAADKAAADAAANVKTATDNKAKAEKAVADLTNQQKDLDAKFKAAEKQFADADAAVKAAEVVVKNSATNLEGTTAVAKNADEAVASEKKLLADAEAVEKQTGADLEAAKKLAADSEKKTRALVFAGAWLVIAAEDNTLRYYSAEHGWAGSVRTISDKPIAALAFDGTNLLAQIETNTLALPVRPVWKLERQIGDNSEKSPLSDRVLSVTFSPDGKLLATAGGVPSRSGELKLWNVADGSLARELKDPHSDTAYAVRFSPDQRYIASGAADKMMKVFETATGKFVRSFEGHTHHVLNVSWMRHGRTLASAGADSAIKVWDFDSGEQKKTIAGANREITAFQYLEFGSEALAASGDNQLRLLKEDGGNVRTFGGATDYTQTAAMTPDGKILIAGGSDSQFRIWNGEKGDLLKTFAPPARPAKTLANKAAN